MHNKAIFNWQIRVYYEDTDAGGVVYHAQYLKFMERARTEWLRQMGFEHTALLHLYQCVFVVHSLQIQYKKSAKLSDWLNIACTLTKVGYSSIEFLQTISSAEQILVNAQVKLACVDALSFKPVNTPQAVKQLMQKQMMEWV